ncbi:23S rRNA (uracil(1939)-C(5))-methyltransferase RlmD [Blautia wexlerae]|uniref:23S rRNA (uracil(1939)-C(5))-methyltransferase RlmD n=1 Tax=Blautia wexlerae TaxID=418240 RepID=UPI000E49E967|nr:23S rRNA (uracil(1939)-C(5))-methyltransferase RlmD [Blautia wexlerae]RHQ36801.1 23S rRNA (uracil(1939)-C(5))-methyltransferase RlmD [Ruminococcus sp. AF25-28AC]MCB5688660.1 23S rRNA (uracil(1939)-C(5))-methyltransferase RlmD [Blautia wexlerae]NSD00716.1 23S rRNA (uracil(1939)-C(5))-methyltransferase RlmD [Blautia wexlerae]NSE92119.1 23S rRNA (uracil(1939)-C(5))-methyltransferase RlmD [Blautia wexlerae]NSF34829.1 23S rRNA (uracil(1939)-C(5))-methyltransferase RlmD [Blautia wexlerae]
MEFRKNDLVTLEIEDCGIDGEGIGKADGFTVFVKDAVIGDTVTAKIIKAKKNYGYGRLMEVLKPSPYRVEPKCKFARQCGGCQLQALSYDQQLVFKTNKVKGHLERIGGFTDIPMEPIIGMDELFHYRNKAQFPVGRNKEGKIVTGFYAGRTHNIIENRDCALGVAENKEVLDRVIAHMEKYGIEPYNEATGKGLVRHVLIRYGYFTKEVMVCLILNGNKLPKEEQLVKSLCEIPGMTSITINVNKKRSNVILGEEICLLWGQEYITDRIGDISYQISPLSFYQVNPMQTQKLYAKALEYADLHGEETVWDLYCGIGTISLFLAQKAKFVRGVEIVPAAIENAKENAKLNGLENTEFFVGKAEEVLPREYKKNGVYADVIVVDPPRKGCDETLLETMVEMNPERIVYVSCDSATLARDLKYLCERGYELRKVCPVDQFGMTVHVETVVLLSQQKPDDTIEIDLDLDELDVTSAELKATYQEIKDYVLKEFGLKVSNLYISQVKRKCGIEVGENYNLPKSENARVPQCPKEKEDAIKAAMKYFAMI